MLVHGTVIDLTHLQNECSDEQNFIMECRTRNGPEDMRVEGHERLCK